MTALHRLTLTTLLLLAAGRLPAHEAGTAPPSRLAEADDNAITYHNLMEEEDSPGRALSLQRALEQVRAMGDGKVVSTATTARGGIYVHTIRLIAPDGQERVYVIDGDDIH